MNGPLTKLVDSFPAAVRRVEQQAKRERRMMIVALTFAAVCLTFAATLVIICSECL